MSFEKYQHVKRFGTDEVKGINVGTCIIMPKLDGTNASVWLESDIVTTKEGVKKEYYLQAGSRNRALSLEKDNHGFYKYVLNNEEKYYKFFIKHKNWRLFGEWLVLHSLKTYREDAWKNFYVFDVIEHYDEENYRYVPYEEYQPELEKYDIQYVPVIAVMKNPTYEQLIHEAENNSTFLIKEGKGVGEGIVIKNYDFTNKYGRTTWAKIVLNTFKEKHHKEMGAPIKENTMIEQEIVDKYCDKFLIDKTYNKIRSQHGTWKSQYIPELLGRVWHDFVTENIWDAIKKNKNPIIDFSVLHKLVIHKIKEVKSELF